MSQELKHKDRLSSIDASFLMNEHSNTHMHVGGVLIFEGPPPKYSDFVEGIEHRLHQVPRFRQKLGFPPLEAGRPIWIDDPNFNLEYHVRHAALPSPGSEQQLKELTSRIFSQQLDRTKPLWEIWFIQGLSKNRFALISKTHHALVDGISGVDLSTVILDLEHVPREVELPDEQWVAHPEPTDAEMVMDGIRERFRQPLNAARSLVRAVEHPKPAVRRVTEAVEGIGEVAWAMLNPAPETFLNVEIGPHRRLEWCRFKLDGFKEIKNAQAGTVNDVLLTVVSGALTKFFRRRGRRTEGLELSGLVPVSIRTEDEHGTLGNRIAAVRGPLPLYADEPLQRLKYVHEAMDGVKDSKQALGAEVISGMNDFMPPTLLSQASRINFSTRLFNLIVTNVPGPQFPLYMQGRQLLDVFPVAFLPERHALAIAIFSYNGELNVGLLADYDVLPDAYKLVTDMQDSFNELYDAAVVKGAAVGGDSKNGKSKNTEVKKQKKRPSGGGSRTDGKTKAKVKAKTKSGSPSTNSKKGRGGSRKRTSQSRKKSK